MNIIDKYNNYIQKIQKMKLKIEQCLPRLLKV